MDNLPGSSRKLEKLLSFLGVTLCYKCRGKGRIEERAHNGCSCCDREITTCPECKGDEFIIEEHSIFKSLTNSDEDETSHNVGLCD